MACNGASADEVCDGFTGAQLFSQGVCYTYDDVIFHPGHIFFGAHEVRLGRWATQLLACGRVMPSAAAAAKYQLSHAPGVAP